jgi:hypothetical protein
MLRPGSPISRSTFQSRPDKKEKHEITKATIGNASSDAGWSFGGMLGNE